jgi:hypothetical protein
MHTLAICTLMANEAPYVQEWVHCHARLGVSLFRVYVDRTRADLPDDGTARLLSSMARDFNIEVVDWTEPGPKRQVAAFNAGLEALEGKAEWVAFVDVDEFLCPPTHLPEWLGALPADVSAIAVQQRVFGSAGRLDMPREPVTAAYTMRATTDYAEHLWYKSIVRPERIAGFHNSHHAVVRDGGYVLGDGGSFVAEAPGRADRIAKDGLRLHHYMLRSRAEWLAKKAKGALSDGAAPGFQRFTAQYAERDRHCNAVIDTTLADLHAPYAAYKRQEAEAMKVWENACH